ncbi:MAG: methylmalonyl Co-A mutase-associated GTPase MeaB [Deltaproteobacteria bacterium]|nr:methylmalonyl Co-A mutase-associated GTPase MeaB [Deltaproteobacteria bacterium]
MEEWTFSQTGGGVLKGKAMNRQDLADRFRAGDRRAVARIISLIEQGDPLGTSLLAELYDPSKRAIRIGLTGAPGVGKSTLVNSFASILEKQKKKIGVVAIDPSSPFTKGAFLGDRVRMQDIKGTNVFVRSMATRGSTGGLSWPAWLTTAVLEAFGFDTIVIETVGVGQVDVEIRELVDTTCVVLQPEAGDSMQFLKAGLMEIADIYVVNKADKPGTNAMVADLKDFVKLITVRENGWRPPVVLTIANTGKGLDELIRAIDSHKGFLEQTKELDEKRKARIKRQLKQHFYEKMENEIWRAEWSDTLVQAAVNRIISGGDALKEAEELAASLIAGPNPV